MQLAEQLEQLEQLEPPVMEPPEQLDYQEAELQVPTVPPEVLAEVEATPSRND